MIAAVREVMAAAAAAGSSVSRSGSMSANTGVAPAIMIAKRGKGRRDRGRDHFVTRADAHRAQRQRQRVRAVPDTDAMSAAGRRRELGFERLDFRSQNEPAALDDAIDGLTDDLGVRAGDERHERDARRHAVHRVRR